MSSILAQESENEVRVECYAELCEEFLSKVRKMELPGEEKKAKEIQSLTNKFER
jgi:hypothetical protein